MLAAGEIDLGWICGTPYVCHTDAPDPRFGLLVAPVQAGARYGGQPVYFSDVVVRAASPYRCFDDLRGARWGYNEPHSHSGYFVYRAYLVARGETNAFFGSVTETGAHATSIAQILAGAIDAAAIDSTVLELLRRDDPLLAAQVRVVATMGPSSAPPWVVQRRLDRTLRAQLRAVMLTLHEDPAARPALAAGGLARFAAVTDADYNDIRRAAALSDRA